jgi:hypothetical protein
MPSSAWAATSGSPCRDQQFGQPFSFWPGGQTHWYTLVPGQSPNNFTGTGWTLSGGAQVLSDRLADGTTGSVLSLPPGSSATSPPTCVSSWYTDARMLARVVNPPAPRSFPGFGWGGSYPRPSYWWNPFTSNQLTFTVTPAGSSVPSHSSPVLVHAYWWLTPSVLVTPGNHASRQVRFTLTSHETAHTFEVYDLYADPRMHLR